MELKQRLGNLHALGNPSMMNFLQLYKFFKDYQSQSNILYFKFFIINSFSRFGANSPITM